MSFSSTVAKVSPFGFVGRVIRLPLRLIPRRAVVPILSGINRGNKWIAGSGETSTLWIGTYESDHLAALESLVRPGMVVYDIGANVGYYTLAFSRLVGDTGRVYSFEPEANNVRLLRRHLALNQVRNVTLIQTAVSDVDGMVGFSGAQSTGKIASESSYQVPSISLDGFISSGNPPPSFIKMDIEGAESLALAGASRLLSLGSIPWMLATHGDEIRARCCEILAPHGYRLVAFDGVSDAGNASDFLAVPALHASPSPMSQISAVETAARLTR